MTTQEYVYRVASIERIVDGDTYWLHLDVGFRQTMLTEIRLLGYDCPETRQGSAYERDAGKLATQMASDWLGYCLSDAGATVWVRTQKDPDDFGRWLGHIWVEGSQENTPTILGEALLATDLATVWPQRWHEKYDPDRDRSFVEIPAGNSTS